MPGVRSGRCSLTGLRQPGRQLLDPRREPGHLVLARQVQPADGLLHGGVDPGFEVLASGLRLREQVVDELLALDLRELRLRGQVLAQLFDLLLGHHGQAYARQQRPLDEIDHVRLLRLSELGSSGSIIREMAEAARSRVAIRSRPRGYRHRSARTWGKAVPTGAGANPARSVPRAARRGPRGSGW